MKNSTANPDASRRAWTLPERGSAAISFGFYRRNALIALIVFVGAYGLALTPKFFDLPLERAINSYADYSPVLDRLFFDLDTFYIFSGMVLVAVIWGYWFEPAGVERRARLIVGIFVAIAVGAASRFMQHVLRTHPRPFYDPALGFHLPSVLTQTPLNTWDSFPSDHAAVFFGLAAIIFTERPRLGLFAFLWLAFVESARAYLGAHYPSDLIGGAALGAGFVWFAQGTGLIRLGGRIAGWERLSPSLFYMCAFVLSYQLATIFADIRSVLGIVTLVKALRHHLP